MSDRFRTVQRELGEGEMNSITSIKEWAEMIESRLDSTIPGPDRYKALALTALEEAVMWAVKGITQRAPR